MKLRNILDVRPGAQLRPEKAPSRHLHHLHLGYLTDFKQLDSSVRGHKCSMGRSFSPNGSLNARLEMPTEEEEVVGILDT